MPLGKLKITEHTFEVPRDYDNPSAGKLRIFARSACKADTSNPTIWPATSVPVVSAPTHSTADGSEHDKKSSKLPWLAFLEGGPGFECRPPQSYPLTRVFIDKGYQLIFIDQRGTGLSSALNASTLGLRGDDTVQINYLKCFRADSIVKDYEAIRLALTQDYPPDKRKWSILGQSFGGFCCTTYLSFHPHGLREAFIIGGLPPLIDHPDAVYEALYHKVIERNEVYYRKFPEDVERVRAIVALLNRFGAPTLRLPSGGTFSVKRFQQLGRLFGFHGGIDMLHNIVLRASNDLEIFGHFTRATLAEIDNHGLLDDNPLYAILHEAIYCQGKASNWSAERIRKKFSQFEPSSPGPIYFTGEMIFHSQFEDHVELRGMRDVANGIANLNNWPPLYNKGQLAANEVPVYAAIYNDDMYVDSTQALKTAKAIRGCKHYFTNNMFHDAVRSRTDELFKSLLGLKEDTLD